MRRSPPSHLQGGAASPRGGAQGEQDVQGAEEEGRAAGGAQVLYLQEGGRAAGVPQGRPPGCTHPL